MAFKQILLVLLSILFVSVTYANDSIQFTQSIKLLDNPVFAITQDCKGFIWIGSKNGLIKYNGIDHQTFIHSKKDSTSLSNDWIWSLLYDKNNNLWIGTGDGLNVWQDSLGTFREINLPELKESSSPVIVKKIMQDSSGVIWVGTNQGLFEGKNNNTEFSKCQLGYDLSQSSDFAIKEITQSTNGNILVSSKYGVFIRKERQWKKFTEESDLASDIDLTKEDIRTLFSQTDSDKLWIGSESEDIGLIEFSTKKGYQITNFQKHREKNRIRVIKSFEKGYLWIGTMGGLVHYEIKTGKTKTYLAYRSIRDIYKDRDSGIWVGTYYNGVYYFNPKKQQFHHKLLSSSSQNNLPQSTVNDIKEVHNGEVWLASNNGLQNFNYQNQNFAKEFNRNTYPKMIKDNIKCVEYNSDNNTLWFGTYSGLSSINLRNNTINNYAPFSSLDNNSNEVLSIGIADNEIWIGTNGEGIFCLNKDKSFTQFKDHYNRNANYIKTILVQSDSLMWVGSNAGLCAFDMINRKFVNFENSHYLFPDYNIMAIVQDKEKKLWLVTEFFGLIYFDPSTFKSINITEKNGLNSNEIRSIALDEQENLWFTSKKGISQLSWGSNEEKFDSLNFTIFDFEINSNMEDIVFSRGIGEKLSNGSILFPTYQGIISFYPKNTFTSYKYPKVWLTDIEINKSSVKLTPDLLIKLGNVENINSLELPHDQSNLRFKLTSFDYHSQDMIYYAYALEGMHPEWQIINNRNDLSYNYLPPGKYTLKVKASNSIQKWGDDFTQLDITILPPFYLSNKAFIIYGLVILLLLYLFYYYISKWQKMKAMLTLEEFDKNKEHELHQVKSEFFFSIAHELKTPLFLMLAPVNELLTQKIENINIRNRLKMVKRNAQKISGLVDQIIDIRKIENSAYTLTVSEIDICQFAKNTSLAFYELARIKNIDFNIEVPNEPVMVWFDSAKMDTVITNLLSNAFKYTNENGEVTISVTLKQNEKNLNEELVQILVEDNGSGISKEDIPHLFDRFHHISHGDKRFSLESGLGLELSKKIIDTHKGEILVESVSGKDRHNGFTRISVQLKKGTKHFEEGTVFDENTEKESKSMKLNNEILSENYNSYHLPTNSINNANSPKMIIVETEPQTVELLRKEFSNSYSIYIVADGLEAWKLSIDIIPNIVLTIEDTENINGHDLCRKIKEDDRTCHIPVILIAEESRNDKHDIAADDFILKPIDLNYLKQRVDYLVGQKERIKKQFEKKSLLKPEQISSYDEQLIDKVVSYIEENLSNPDLSVTEMSREIGMSRVHFYRKLKALMNLSPNEFIRNYRIIKASQLLEQKKHNISDVRIAVGFKDADYFRLCFKKEFGLTPSDYINQCQEV